MTSQPTQPTEPEMVTIVVTEYTEATYRIPASELDKRHLPTTTEAMEEFLIGSADTYDAEGQLLEFLEDTPVPHRYEMGVLNRTITIPED